MNRDQVSRRRWRGLRRRLLDWYQPIDFTGGAGDEHITLELLRRRTADQAGKTADVDAETLRRADLRFSILFPHRLLHRRSDGRSVLVDADTAAELLQRTQHDDSHP